jgi:periplasmic divalent cation tolerance protein
MHIVVFVTVPSEETGKKIARKVIEERLAACVNITAEITSVYWWEDEIQEDNERMLIIKTKSQLFDKLQETVKTHHPYSVPEIIALPMVKGFAPYLNWINQETSSFDEDPSFMGVNCNVLQY